MPLARTLRRLSTSASPGKRQSNAIAAKAQNDRRHCCLPCRIVGRRMQKLEIKLAAKLYFVAPEPAHWHWAEPCLQPIHLSARHSLPCHYGKWRPNQDDPANRLAPKMIHASGWLLKTAEIRGAALSVRAGASRAFPGSKRMELLTAAIKQKSFFPACKFRQMAWPWPTSRMSTRGFPSRTSQRRRHGPIPKKEPERKKNFFQVFSVALPCQTGHAYYEQGKGRQCALNAAARKQARPGFAPAVNIPGFRKESGKERLPNPETARPSIRLRQRADWRKVPRRRRAGQPGSEPAATRH